MWTEWGCLLRACGRSAYGLRRGRAGGRWGGWDRGISVAASQRAALLRGGGSYGTLPHGWCFPPFFSTTAFRGRQATRRLLQAHHPWAAALDLPLSLKQHRAGLHVGLYDSCGRVVGLPAARHRARWARGARLPPGLFSVQLAATNGEGPSRGVQRSLVDTTLPPQQGSVHQLRTSARWGLPHLGAFGQYRRAGTPFSFRQGS